MDVAPGGYPDPRRREPLWDRVDRNRLKLAGYVALFVVLSVLAFDALFVAALALGGLLTGAVSWRLASGGVEPALASVVSDPRAALLGASAVFAAVALGWALFVLARSEKWLLRRLGAVLVPKGEELESKMALKDMAIAAGLAVAPALYVIESTNVNAFVFSARRRRAVVGVTRGLLQRLDADEQRAVFANLVARLASGDTIAATGVTALMWPVHAWRDGRLMAQNAEMDDELLGRRADPATRNEGIALLFVFGVAFAVLGEIVAWGHRGGQLRAAEKADAEGMLLLKDPRAMLGALQKCVRYDNAVPSAGEAFADLFYCWTGDSTSDDDDPEWMRVARLREVLGVEGFVAGPTGLPQTALPPPPPRFDG